ncbi:MAG: cytochrome d ubiquinol oxidase subunit II [Methylosarcina sp.]
MEHPVSEFLINSWAAILTLILTVYAALDGFDLGIGILSLLERDKYRKIVMMESLNGVWDANETWLVLIGGVLFGAFPLAYAAVLQALYVPVLLMLFALIFRGIAFEFRLYAARQEYWILAFGIGSLLAALSQGLALGGLLSGLKLVETSSLPTLFYWASPFSLLTAAVLATVYALLGASYLLYKVEGAFHDELSRVARWTVLMLVVLFPLFLWGSIKVMPQVAERWLDQPLWFGILAACTVVPVIMVILGLTRRRDINPFFWGVAALVMVSIGLATSHYPFLIPGAMTLHMAASSTRTLEFMLWAIGGLLPLMLGYNAYQYYVFRGQIRPEH